MTRSEQLFAAFAKFHRENPHVFTCFCEYVAEAIAAGHSHYGANDVLGQIRWHYAVRVKVEGRIKINNNHAPFYARLYHKTHPEHADFFNLRHLTSKDRPAYKEDIQEWPGGPPGDEADLDRLLDALLY